MERRRHEHEARLMAIYSGLRRMLFALEAETSHDFALAALAGASRSRIATALLAKCNRRRDLPRKVMGINFPNPVGLAAGLDKRARACNALHALGFGWVELGAVTPLPQPGNPKPRIFRLPEQHALINRMGFNSGGLASFVRNLARAAPGIIKGVNIGKNAATAMDDAHADYAACMEAVHMHADYISVNISSPNTQGLRDLQEEGALAPLLAALNRKRGELAEASGRRVPLVLKIAPDLGGGALDALAGVARKHRIDGIAATNTTLSRDGVGHALAGEVGGLSGAPLGARATETVARLSRNLQGEIPIIGVGGIDSAEDALEKFEAGAELVQIYTGFIYRGPRLIGEIIERLRARQARPAEKNVHSANPKARCA
ncbi:MAG: Dihydroorotate dehydrogenase (quinone) [Arenicellales bacterium IbO2]|nr:MAG: Dihydroorotate dehydrogenase (quinone) [Arenicellales bacterium IbO2]